jgi:hypothetical protein
MNGTLHTTNDRRWRGEITSDEDDFLVTGVPVPRDVEVVGLPVQTISVPRHNVSHVVWDDPCAS